MSSGNPQARAAMASIAAARNKHPLSTYSWTYNPPKSTLLQDMENPVTSISSLISELVNSISNITGTVSADIGKAIGAVGDDVSGFFSGLTVPLENASSDIETIAIVLAIGAGIMAFKGGSAVVRNAPRAVNYIAENAPAVAKTTAEVAPLFLV